MPLSRDEFTTYITDGVREIGLTLTPFQVEQFFFTSGNYKSGIGK